MSANHEGRMTARVGGIAGLVFAAGVLLQNGYLLQGNPMPDATLEEVRAFYAASHGRIEVAVGWVAPNILCLLTFGAAVTERLSRSPRTSLWGRVAFGAVVLLAAAFSVTTALQGALVASVAALETSGLLQAFWDLHSTAFAMSAIALSVVLLGLSVGTLSDSEHALVPRWVALLGLGGSASLLVAGGLSVSSVSGGPGIVFQLGGFATWLVWLVAGAIGLLRTGAGGGVVTAPA